MEFLIAKKAGGYEQEQVDSYIQELRQAYQQIYESYEALRRQCMALEHQCQEQGQALAYAQAEAAQLRCGYGQYGMQGYGYAMQDAQGYAWGA